MLPYLLPLNMEGPSNSKIQIRDVFPSEARLERRNDINAESVLKTRSLYHGLVFDIGARAAQA